MSLIRRSLGALASGRLTTLIYHRVRDRPDPLFPDEVDAARFAEQMQLLVEHFTPLPVSEAIDRLNAGTLPRAAVCITFDDGYADNCTVATPILRRLGLSAAFFIATGFVDGGSMWNDLIIEAIRNARFSRISLGEGEILELDGCAAKRSAIEQLIRRAKYLSPDARMDLVDRVCKATIAESPAGLMLSGEQIRVMRDAGMEFGGHTCRHPILASLTAKASQDEISIGKSQLEAFLGASVTLFAYPNGKPRVDYSAEHVLAAKAAGFRAAFTTAPGFAHQDSDLMQLPRFTPWDRDERRFALRLSANYLRQQQATA